MPITREETGTGKAIPFETVEDAVLHVTSTNYNSEEILSGLVAILVKENLITEERVAELLHLGYQREESIIDILTAKFPDCTFRKGVEFDGNENRLVWSGEGSNIEGYQAFDPYSFETDPQEHQYTMMIHNDLAEFCKDLGYYWESYDPGTFFLYKD